MMTSDDTQLLGKNTQVENPQNEQTAPVAEETSEKQSATWKKVAIGGTSGILLGAGALYAVNAMAGETQADAADPATASPQAAGSAVATVEDDMTFAEAFQSARAQVGPGGVFEWHGGVYGTYTADEWNAMSAEDKAAFTQTAMSNVHPHSYQPTAHTAVHQTDVEVHREVVYERETVKEPEDGHSGRTAEDGGHVRTATTATTASHEEPFVQETEDVHIVGQTKFQGHQAVVLDCDGDAQPDVAVIDVNDNNQLDDQDVLIFRDGTTMTRGELAQSMSEDETGDVTPQTEHQPDHTEGYMQTAYEGAEPDGTTDGYDGLTGEYDGAQEDPYLHQASYSEDINTANDEGMMDPNLQQASYSEDPAMGYDDPNLGVDGVDGVDDAGTDMQYI